MGHGTAESAPGCSRGVRCSFLAYSSTREELLVAQAIDAGESAEVRERCGARSYACSGRLRSKRCVITKK